MTGDREPVVAKVPHERDHVFGHRSLGGLRMHGRICWQCGLPVAAQVRADNEERVRKLRRYAMPGGVRAGVTMQLYHWLSLAAMPHAERHIADIDVVQLKAIEHEPRLPREVGADRRGVMFIGHVTWVSQAASTCCSLTPARPNGGVPGADWTSPPDRSHAQVSRTESPNGRGRSPAALAEAPDAAQKPAVSGRSGIQSGSSAHG